jgi:5-methylcytosine-specific restriction enzyme subunit McrC
MKIALRLPFHFRRPSVRLREARGFGQGTAMLFEMNALFEEYVGRLIARALAGTGLTVSLQGGRLFCLSAQDSGRALFQTRPDILIRQGGRVVQVIDTKWKRISARIDDPKQGVSQADVYQMMAYAQLYRTPRVTLLYPHHAKLGTDEMVHARYCVTGHTSLVEVASIDVSSSADILTRLRGLLINDPAAEDMSSLSVG